ncbi:MAG TPA: glucose-6-phosphate isomerase [Verrucomicrobiales bacterium]|nr:glucose-6-phosphate isomerase [Verrucomicrobiales bacterium]
MTTSSAGSTNWERFQSAYTEFPTIELAIDVSRMAFPAGFFQSMAAPMQRAFASMAALEAGSIANPDEKRMVGHYWLRAPELAPAPELRREIEETVASVKAFAREVHEGRLQGATGPFARVLVIGIGGSALGPQFVANALGQPASDRLLVSFFDNTDPDGIDKVLSSIRADLGRTLCVVISKSGGTKETRNGMLEAQSAWEKAGLRFAQHAVAVTGAGSELDQHATRQQWIRRFPMWDWVGGRTSELSAVGLLPAALQGIDIDRMLAGARACDALTRLPEIRSNPAALLALMWHHAGGGRGARDMVVLPYKDRLELFSKYLQQLIMESLGKELDLAGHVVNQGIAVYGNKGSTDQHAYVQQLREGLHNFFVTFIEVLRDRPGTSIEVEPGVTSGDFLSGFYLGTRQALHEKGRESITLTVREVSPFAVGVLIALFERAVGLYASLVNINAYHQPGVEAGKKAAGAVIALQGKIQSTLRANPARSFTVEQLGAAIGADDLESIFKICEHLSANPGRGVRKAAGSNPFLASYSGGGA